MNIFVGDNAQGKTNILEAIAFLALTKSHRIGVNPNIIEFGKEKTKLTGTISKNKVISKLQIEMTDNSKKLKINHSDIRKVANYISYLNIIIFTPDDLEFWNIEKLFNPENLICVSDDTHKAIHYKPKSIDFIDRKPGDIQLW